MMQKCCVQMLFLVLATDTHSISCFLRPLPYCRGRGCCCICVSCL